MFCEYCGKELPDGVKFCTGCGKQVNDAGEAGGGGQKAEGKPAFSEMLRSKKVLFIALGVLIAVIAAVILYFTVLKPKPEKNAGNGAPAEDRKEKKEKEEKEEKKKKEEEEEEKEEPEEEEDEEGEMRAAAQKALMNLMEERDQNAVCLYTVKDFNRDGIYEVLIKPADLSAEIGRFAYDGEAYQCYGTSDEGWDYYDMEDGLEYYPSRDVLAFVGKGIALPEKPTWLAEYAGWLEDYGDTAISPEDGVYTYADYTEALDGAYAIWLANTAKR